MKFKKLLTENNDTTKIESLLNYCYKVKQNMQVLKEL
jgi:hypothetical protein